MGKDLLSREKEMTISKKHEEQYQKTLEQTRERIKSIEEEMANELVQARQRLRELLEEKKAMLKIYDGLASLLGVENEFKKKDEEEQIQASDLPGPKSKKKKD